MSLQVQQIFNNLGHLRLSHSMANGVGEEEYGQPRGPGHQLCP